MRGFTICLILGVAVFAHSAHSEPQATKRIALTFDDAPRGDGPMFSGQERTSVLLESLKRTSTGPVAFFVHTGFMQRGNNRARIHSYADAGHLIANHSHEHPWLSRTDTDVYLAGIDQAETLLEGFPNRRKWFRFPFLDEGVPVEKRDAVRAGLTQRGLFNGYVTVDNYDWYFESKWRDAVREERSVDLGALQEAYVDTIVGAVHYYDDLAVQTLGRSPAHTLLLHENDVAALFVDDLVAALRSDGWTIISPDEAYNDPIADIVPKTLMTRQGHVGALAIDMGYATELPAHGAISEAQIDELLMRLEVFSDGEVELP